MLTHIYFKFVLKCYDLPMAVWLDGHIDLLKNVEIVQYIVKIRLVVFLTCVCAIEDVGFVLG